MPNQAKLEDKSVSFGDPLPTRIMAVDGTWRRECGLREISGTYAKLEVGGSVQGISLKEFFLVLSSSGLAYRRCKLEGVRGSELTVSFLRRGKDSDRIRSFRAQMLNSQDDLTPGGANSLGS
jgi:hypothetical protein